MKKYKTTKEHLDTYKASLANWIIHFGLQGWCVYVNHAKINGGDTFANMGTESVHMVATTQFSKIFHGEEPTEERIKNIGLHESLHLLLARLTTIARNRYISHDELYAAEEEVVNKLVNVLKEHPYHDIDSDCENDTENSDTSHESASEGE
jgi:hypothetical protein